MHFLGLLLIPFGVAVLSCARNDARPGTDPGESVGVAAQAKPVPPADTEIVRSAGVPTDADDTATTRYGKHETPRRVAYPDCRPRGIALCLPDTATTVYSVACCMADERQTDWLVFAAARDSMQLFLLPTSGAYLFMSPANAAGAVAENSGGVDASWMRARFPAAGSYIFTAGIESDSPVPYELRVAPVIATGASQPIGAAARLTLLAHKKSVTAIAPRSMMPTNDTTALRRFAVKPGTYRVVLVRDTVYDACVLPCTSPKSFPLRRGQTVTITLP